MAPADALMTGVLPQQQPFRRQHEPQIDLCLLPDDDTERGYALHAVVDAKPKGAAQLYPRIDAGKHHSVPMAAASETGIEPWAEVDYLAALQALAETLDRQLEDCAKRFGTVTVPASDNGWSFHPGLGFAKVR